jgi:hypothetical protein
MKKYIQFLLTFFVVLAAGSSYSQHEPEKAGTLQDGKFILKINLDWSEQQKERFAELFDLDSLLVSAIFESRISFINDSTAWVAKITRPGLLELSKDLNTSPGILPGEIILSGLPEHSKSPPPPAVSAAYGVNNFSASGIFNYSEGTACFKLPGYKEARSVFLSGSFNQWSTMQLPMQKTDTGWVACLQLPPGKHLYKYIVDGRWMSDPNNRNRENDGHRSYNSSVFCYNYVFNLEGHERARRVVLAASFNGWNTRELMMNKTAKGWTLPLFVREGTHAYKFIVDGNWITDPANPVTRPDGAGNVNSFIGIGDTLLFRLRMYHDANTVILSGTFNAWNTGELFMEKYEDGWRLPYVLAAGNYEYKYIVDGRWITDPINPFTTGSGDFNNSFIAFKPNHLFVLKAHADARDAIITGSFNGWSTTDYRMVLRDDEWVFPIYLQPGRHSYKFIVDGNWILDPANPLWEENEFGTDNSVLWIEF